jgi:hypothetical protein
MELNIIIPRTKWASAKKTFRAANYQILPDLNVNAEGKQLVLDIDTICKSVFAIYVPAEMECSDGDMEFAEFKMQYLQPAN